MMASTRSIVSAKSSSRALPQPQQPLSRRDVSFRNVLGNIRAFREYSPIHANSSSPATAALLSCVASSEEARRRDEEAAPSVEARVGWCARAVSRMRLCP
jgi:hypothetical protein